MPINLRYGQQAVSRGFITPQRLKQVLAKQKQLAEQGKKVSVRMILEKAKLLNAEQLAQVDRDLNIKVIKKRTGQFKKPPEPQPRDPVTPADPADKPKPSIEPVFPGGTPPKFEGMDGDAPEATVFSPPPADMQDRIRREREKAVDEAAKAPEEEGFFGDDSASPFGDDPFGGGDMSPEPAAEMSPEPAGGDVEPEPEDLSADSESPFGDDPFAQDMAPEPADEEMQPEPAGADLQPDQGGFDDDSASPFGDDPFAEQAAEPQVPAGNQPAELDRMDSSPKLSSLQAESEGFASPEDEDLPAISAADESGEPASANLAPDRNDSFADFGNDIRSPEELEASGGDRPAGGREKTGAMDRTVFSPRPPEFGGPPIEAEPQGDSWGEEGLPESEPFADEPARDEATMFSPPPPGTPGRNQHESQRGRRGADDFGDVDLPTGKQIDDVPTAPASMEDDIHPIRRGVGTSSARVSSGLQPVPSRDDDIADELPEDEPSAPRPPAGKKASGRRSVPRTEPEVRTEAKPKRGTRRRVLLSFVILLLIAIAILVLPVALYDSVPEVRPLRDEPRAAPVYDYVEDIYNSVQGLISPEEDTDTDDSVSPTGGEDETGNGAGDNEAGDDTAPEDEEAPGDENDTGEEGNADANGDESADDGAVE